MTKKKVLVSICAGICALSLILAGSFAWYTTQQTKLNNLQTKAEGGLALVEDFDEESAKEMKPGVDVDKKVSVVQTGDSPAITRVRLEEQLTLMEADATGTSLKIYNEASATATTVTGGPANSAAAVAVTVTKDSLVSKLQAQGFITSTQTLTDAVKVAAAKLPTGLDASTSVYVKTTVVGLVTTYSSIAVRDLGNDTYQTVDVVVNATDKSKIDSVSYEFYNKLTPQTADINLLDGTYAPSATPVVNDKSQQSGKIWLNMNTVAVKPISDWSGTAEKAWFYDTDGWCYWGDLIETGEATSNLLESVKLDSTAGNEMSLMNFDINVRMMGIQPTAEAVKDEWNTAVGTYAARGDGTFEILTKVGMTTAAKTLVADVIGCTVAELG